jgi:hypothetical protein
VDPDPLAEPFPKSKCSAAGQDDVRHNASAEIGIFTQYTVVTGVSIVSRAR